MEDLDQEISNGRYNKQMNENKLIANNVVSIRAFRTLRECKRLFSGYQQKLYKMNKSDLLTELDRYRIEAGRYPCHLLTIVKGEILLRILKGKSLTADLKSFAAKEEKRIQLEVSRRLHD